MSCRPALSSKHRSRRAVRSTHYRKIGKRSLEGDVNVCERGICVRCLISGALLPDLRYRKQRAIRIVVELDCPIEGIDYSIDLIHKL